MTTKDSLKNDRNDIPAEHNITKIDDWLIERIISHSDEELACKNLEDALNLIEGDTSLSKEEKEELKTFLRDLYKKAMPYFTKRAEANPAYHHTQVLYNMVRLALGEKCNYKELRSLLVLALLHDIGDAICTHTRVVGSRIAEAFERAKSEKDQGKKAKLAEEATKLARQGMAFRLEHMDKGPKLIKKVTKDYVNAGKLEEDDLHLICRAVVIHDYPSIEKSLDALRKNGIEVKYERGTFLLPFNDPAIGRLITFLREADRLFMLSVQGVIKDLKGKNEKISADAVIEQGGKSIENHRTEYGLYKNSCRDDGGFIKSESLYRTFTGYTILDEAKRKYKNH